MKISVLPISTLKGTSYKIKEEENIKEFFEGLVSIQEKEGNFDPDSFAKYETFYDDEECFDESIVIDSFEDDTFYFNWGFADYDDRESNFSQSLFLRVPKKYLEEYFGTNIEIVI